MAQRGKPCGIATYLKGEAEFRCGALDIAVEEYSRYAFSENAEERYVAVALANIGYIYFIQRKYELSLSYYRKALKFRLNKDDLFNAGQLAFELNLFPEARRYFLQVLEADPTDTLARRAVTSAEFRLGNYLQAEKRAKECIEKEPNEPFPYLLLAGIYDEKEEYDKAIEVLHEALRRWPDYVDALVSLGVCYEDRGSHEDALEYYRRAAEMEPDNPKHQYVLGNAYFLLKRFPDALEHFRRAHALDFDGVCNDLRQYYSEPYLLILDISGLDEEAKVERDALKRIEDSESGLEKWKKWGQ